MDASNIIVEKIKAKLKIYLNDNVIKQAELGGFPAKDSADKKRIERFKKESSGDFQKAYEDFVIGKYEDLAYLQCDGRMRMELRTTLAEVRQDYQKYIDLSDEYATLISNKFAGNSAVEREAYKARLHTYAYHKMKEYLADDLHLHWGSEMIE